MLFWLFIVTHMPLFQKASKSTSELNSIYISIEELAQLQQDLCEKNMVIGQLMRQVERLKSTPSSPSKSEPVSSCETSPRSSYCASPATDCERRRTFSCADALGPRRSRLTSITMTLTPSRKETRPQEERIIEWPYEDLVNGAATNVDPEHLEQYLSEEDCQDHFGISKAWIEGMSETKLYLFKDRARLTADHFRMAKNRQNPVSSPTGIRQIVFDESRRKQ